MGVYIYKLALKKEYQDFSAWHDRVHYAFKRHAEYLQAAVKAGTALIVGRTDADLKNNYGIVVFTADDKEKATEFMQKDPCVSEEIMTAELSLFKLMMVADAAKQWNIW
jgi:uncharacterized protein